MAPPEATVRDLARGAFPTGPPLFVERVPEGGSTLVYRVWRSDEPYYLRILPEVGKTFAPEVRAHTLLRERGARVPEVIFYEPCDAMLGLSVMVTTAIAGQSRAREGLGPTARAIVAEAGRDLALINSLVVSGFGWIDRDPPHVAALTAEHPTNRAFLTEGLERHLAILGGGILDPVEVAAVQTVLARHEAWLDASGGHFAHGDLDATHIFQRGGRYTGIIDFGEIRGTDRWYDLGHFALRDGERFATPLLPWLLDGYGEVVPLPPDHRQRIDFAALLIGLRLLARSVEKRGPSHPDPSALRAIRRALVTLPS